jgi:uncharacterized protein (DUF433 family)
MAANQLHESDRLAALESRLRHLEEVIEQREPREAAVEPWHYLVRRQHQWRKQLYVKGRNMTARQLVGSMMANKLAAGQAAADYRLPIDAVQEAIAYAQHNKELLETEAEIERLMVKREKVAHVPQVVS